MAIGGDRARARPSRGQVGHDRPQLFRDFFRSDRNGNSKGTIVIDLEDFK